MAKNMVSDAIIFINDEKKEFLFDGANFSEVVFHNQKNYLNAVVAPSLNIRTHGFKVEKTLTAQNLQMQAEINMFEDGGLNPEIDFAIASLVIPIEDDLNFVESYAIESSFLDEKFGSIVSKYGHLDLIFPPALSYCALYASEILEAKNDLFIHIGAQNAYAVVFKNGQYISTRAIATLEDIAVKVSRETSQLKEILSTKGIEEKLYDEDEFLIMSDLQEQFSKIAERIAHSIGHKRGIFKLDTIDRIYLDFEGADIPGFLNLFNNYGYKDVSKKVLDVFVNVAEGEKHNALHALYALSVAQEKLTPVNLTKYERKPSFLKTKVGEFSMVMLIAVVLAAVYPIYAFVQLHALSSQEETLQNKVTQVTTATKTLQETLASKKQQKNTLEKEKKEVTAKINSYIDMLGALEKFDKDTRMRQKMLQDINQAMKKYKLASKKLEFKEGGFFSVQIITGLSKRDDIAMFMKELLSLGYSSVETKKIQKYHNYYESFVEIHR